MKKPIPFGKYFLLERINVGGMAEVFRAKAYGVEGFERLVAVKRILPNIAEDKEFISMFIDEAKIAVQLNHANIAQIFDLGMVDSSYYIALEHIHGRDLRAIFDRCRNRGQPMPVAQACFVVMKVCEGLDYAHNKRDASGGELGLVHRDVSPQNMLVSFEGEVKLIDFGIAKAAGKGSKTQAGILKGKFGYMSPEQVRGLPIDRRSDIFSCGIVLYELLTGERLFVGESDFSTLEKVRNVEILPPSTYNRKIPDELERIVLKALAKDTEDRYQNAIDLHDELQAFVYTAGEFYSRKDLASWMKKTFAEEIEEESQKLEAYRRLRPPEAQRAPTRPPTVPAVGRSTASFGAPPPSPPPLPGPNGGGRPQPMAMSAAPVGSDLEWDDDELETQIYDNVDHGVGPGAPRNPTAPMGSGGMGAQVAGGASEPDLSSLVSTAKGWEGATPAPQRSDVSPPPKVANGSNNARSPFVEPQPLSAGLGAESADEEMPVADEPSAVVRLVNLAEPIFDPDAPSAFGGSQYVAPQKKSKGALYAVFALLAFALVGGGVLLAVTLGGSDKKDGKGESAGTTADGPGKSDKTSPSAAKPSAAGIPDAVLAKTGFDLFVEPPSIADKVTIKLDGKLSNARPPMQIRRLVPGDHKIEIDAPKGFFSKAETITVVAGQAGRVTIRLDAIDVTGKFTSTPPGALVYLVSGGAKKKLGKTPTEHKLDPKTTYEVVFEKKGYVTQSRPLTLTGRTVENITAVLEKATVAISSDRKRRKRTSDTVAKKDPPPKKVVKKDPPPKKVVKKDPPKKVEYGTFGVGSKPNGCTIYLNGRNVGKTPKLGIRAKAGKHRVTLVCNDHGVRDSFSVRIKPGNNRPSIRNLMHKIKK